VCCDGYKRILGYVDFELDLPGALLARLVQVLDTLTSATLSKVLKFLSSW
jgi:hypothetical protein